MRRMRRLPREIRPAADILLDQWFQIVRMARDPRNFGNVVLDLHRDADVVRLVRDRGVWEFTFTKQGVDWEGQDLWACLEGGGDEVVEPISLDELMALLSNHLGDVLAMTEPLRECVASVRGARVKRLMDGFSAGGA